MHTKATNTSFPDDMAEPPSYDDVLSESSDSKSNAWPSDSKTPQRLSIRDEVGTSRAQHVATLVSKVLPQIRERAKSGLSKTTLLLLPSDQAETSKRGQLVGFPEDDEPVLIRLEGRYDGTQFWSQEEALKLLQEQMLVEVAGELPKPAVVEQPLPPRPAVQQKASFWGRKQSKTPEPPKPVPTSSKPPVTVEVQIEYVNFRTETEYGLYETLRGRAVMVVVVVR